VLFVSTATDMVAGVGDTPGTFDVFVATLPAPGSPGTTSTTTVTTPGPTTTTSTTLPCTSARCALEGVQTNAACAGQTIPARVTGKLEQAANLIDQAASSPAKKARKLLKRAKALKQAEAATTRAAKGRRPKISPDCARALRGAADGVVGGLGV
jgi:hypothetical protein